MLYSRKFLFILLLTHRSLRSLCLKGRIFYFQFWQSLNLVPPFQFLSKPILITRETIQVSCNRVFFILTKSEFVGVHGLL